MWYLRLWRQFIIAALVRETEYRVSFLLSLLEGLAQLVLAVLGLGILYSFTDTVAGWSQPEVLMLTGVYRMVDALIAMQLAPNMNAIAGYIRRGELDFLLLRPVPQQFLVSVRRLQLSEGLNVFVGLMLLVYAGNLARVQWSVVACATAALFGLCGLILLYAVWFCAVTCSFWLQASPVYELFYGLIETARYPVSFFKGWIRALLTFAFPVAFVTTFPTQALTGQSNLQLLLQGLVLASISLVATHLFWDYAVRHYASASS